MEAMIYLALAPLLAPAAASAALIAILLLLYNKFSTLFNKE